MLSKDIMIQCGWCSGTSSIEKWNNVTFNECISREMKRAFKELYNEKSFSRESNTFYKCPLCSSWSRGSQLIIADTDNDTLLKLGREPIIKKIKK